MCLKHRLLQNRVDVWETAWTTGAVDYEDSRKTYTPASLWGAALELWTEQHLCFKRQTDSHTHACLNKGYRHLQRLLKVRDTKLEQRSPGLRHSNMEPWWEREGQTPVMSAHRLLCFSTAPTTGHFGYIIHNFGFTDWKLSTLELKKKCSLFFSECNSWCTSNKCPRLIIEALCALRYVGFKPF